MNPFENILQIAASLQPAALEAVRRELEDRCAPLRAEGEPEGSPTISETEDPAVRVAAAAIFDLAIVDIGLVPACCEVRRALSQLAEQIGVIV